MRRRILFLVLILISLPISSGAELITVVPAQPAGEGGDDSYSATRVGYGWPSTGAGYTCDNTSVFSHTQCLGFGNQEDVWYDFYSPLGSGTAHAVATSSDYFDPMIFGVRDGMGYSWGPCPTPYGYNGYQVEFPVIPSTRYYVVVAGSFYDDPGCGNYDMTLSYTPERLGINGQQGTGGTGGAGGPGGGGGIPCEIQAGSNGGGGSAGSPGGNGGTGGYANLNIVLQPLVNNSRLVLGGLNGLQGQYGPSGSTGGAGGSGGAVLGGGGAGAEPVPDYQPGTTNGGAGGTVPAGTGGNGNNSGGGGGGGGSAPFIGGGFGAGGGTGAQGANGAASSGTSGGALSQTISKHLLLNDPFVIGGQGGQGGNGGQGGHGGGGGGGAGECWGNVQGAGGTGGPGGAGGIWGSGGLGGTGVIWLTQGATLTNQQYIQVGRGFNGGAGAINLGEDARFINTEGDTVLVADNGQINIQINADYLRNDGIIINPTFELENNALFTGHGELTGTLINNGTVRPNSPTLPLMVGYYIERGTLQVSLTTGTVLNCGAVSATSAVTIDSGAELLLDLPGGWDEQDLQFGDGCNVLVYRSGTLTGTYDSLTCQPALIHGVWDLQYGYDLGDGLASVRLVYAEDISPVQESDMPLHYALTGVYPNPFNPRTTISYALPRLADVKFRVYDVKGHLVWSKDELQTAGQHQLVFEGTDRQGRDLPSGSYLLRMLADDFRSTQRMTLVR